MSYAARRLLETGEGTRWKKGPVDRVYLSFETLLDRARATLTHGGSIKGWGVWVSTFGGKWGIQKPKRSDASKSDARKNWLEGHMIQIIGNYERQFEQEQAALGRERTVAIKLPETTTSRLSNAALRLGISRADTIERALNEWLDQQEASA